MFEKVSDYIHIERGVIPRDVCTQTLAVIEASEWMANKWYNPNKNEAFSDQHEPDMLFSTPQTNSPLTPHILTAVQAYSAKYAVGGDGRTHALVTRINPVRFNRYCVGHGMAMHFDHIHSLFDGERKGIPVLSFVGNLNEDYEGGDLVFFDGAHSVALKTGDICMFPSCFVYPHHVQEVRRGTRYSFATWAW